MRKCFNAKRSSILKIWSRRPISTSPTSGAVNPFAKLGTAPTVSSEDEEKLASMPQEQLDNYVKQQLRESIKQKGELPPTHGLPLSPLMDPKLIAARNRYRTPKPQPSGTPSALTERLQKNPYAQALATPIRECKITGARLPSAFLLDFGLAKHPQTGDLWHLPEVALDSTPSPSKSKKDSSNPTSSETPLQTETPDSPPMKRLPVRTTAHTHFLAHSPALHLLSSLNQRSYLRYLPRRWKIDSGIKIENVVWRKDMDTFVLEALRKRVAKLLKYQSSRPAAYMAACKGYEAVRESHQAAAVLWLGPPPSTKGDEDISAADRGVAVLEPPPYAMLTYRSYQIPIYNLPALLGPTHLQQLRESSPVFGGEMSVLKGKRVTVKTQMELWRLMGYLSFPGG